MLQKFLARTTKSAVIWGFTATFLRAGALVFILPLIVRSLPPEELGLWYVFLAVGGLTALLDFGFSGTMMRAVGYVWGGAKELQAMGLQVAVTSNEEPGAPNYPLLTRLIATMTFYYRILAIIILFLMLTGGSWYIWQQTGRLDNKVMLRGAWIFYSFAVALNTLGNLWPTLLSGINGVKQAQQLFAVALLFNYSAVILGLTFHCSIWALVTGQFLMGLVLRQGGKFRFYKRAKLDSKAPAKLDWNLFGILWPMSWRNGLVIMAHYLILGANTFICSAYLGLAETGSYGLSFQVAYFIGSLSAIGVQIKFPLINQYRAQNKLDAIARIFASRMRLMLGIYLLGAVAVIFFGNEILSLIHARTHLVPVPIFIALLLFYFLEIHQQQYVMLIVSENSMPILVPSIITAVAVVLLSVLVTPYFGLWGMVLSFGCASLCYNDWWIVWRGIHGLKVRSVDYWKLFFLIGK